MTGLRSAMMIAPLFLSSLYAGHAAAEGLGGGQAEKQREAVDGNPQPQASEIVVVGRRHGEARVAPESEFSEAEIAAQGADSIGDLLDRWRAFIGDPDNAPVLLVNGKEVGFDRSILSYPPEALDKFAILKPEAASRYGHASRKRVVNLTLKRNFASIDAETSLSAATAGGQSGGALSVRRVAIAGETRWNAQARVESHGALLKSERDISRPDALLAQYGVPDDRPESGAPTMPLSTERPDATISDASPGPAINPQDYETLLPARRAQSFNAGLTRALGEFSASLNLDAGANTNKALRGLADIPDQFVSGRQWEPLHTLFPHTVAIGPRALRNDNRSNTLGLAVTLNGRIGDWQTGIAFQHTHNWSKSLLERRVDSYGDSLLSSPQGPDPDRSRASLGAGLLADHRRSHGQNTNLRFNLSKGIVDLPAGKILSTLAIDVRRSRYVNRRLSNSATGGEIRDVSTQGFGSGQISFNIPLSKGDGGKGFALGDLSADLMIGAQAPGEGRLQKRFGAAIYWSPLPAARLRGSIDTVETAPSLEELSGPETRTVRRVFDFKRQEVVDIVALTGGNPELKRGSQRIAEIAATLLPFDSQTLELSVGYRAQSMQGGVLSFPELTPAIEAAFPERALRDPDGRLIGIDARPITIAHTLDAELNSGLALRLTHGRKRASADPTDVPWQFSLALNHRWRLRSELLFSTGGPKIDQLSAGGGQSTHFLSLQASAGRKGLGANVSGTWSDPVWIQDASIGESERNFRVTPPVIFNMTLFFEPQHLWQAIPSVTRNLKVSIDIQNLFRGYRKVSFGNGAPAAGYRRDDVDPLGRTVRLAIRKRF